MPHLFVLALERLGHKIQDLVDAGSWKPLKFGRGNGPKVSHINFADDLVLIAEASIDQANVIHDVLSKFCSKSGQKVNLKKSKVLFSRNLRDNITSEISQVLGMEATQDL